VRNAGGASRLIGLAKYTSSKVGQRSALTTCTDFTDGCSFCDQCKTYFPTNYDLKEHQASGHGNVPKPGPKHNETKGNRVQRMCERCGSQHSTKFNMKMHQQNGEIHPMMLDGSYKRITRSLQRKCD